MEQKKTQPQYMLHRKLQKQLGQALKLFHLIEKGDRILIGLSGGKDSLSLVELLGERMAHSNHFFEVEALHVRMRNIHYASDASYLQKHCERWNIPFHLVETEFAPDRNEKRTPCFLCSWYRRKEIFAQAKRLNCNKIALGHHQDDILRTALMNMTYNGTFSTMPAKLKMRKFSMTIIRPLACMAEHDLKNWALIQNYQPVDKVCPFDGSSNRTNIQEATDILQKINPEYRYSLWHALLKAGALVEE